MGEGWNDGEARTVYQQMRYIGKSPLLDPAQKHRHLFFSLLVPTLLRYGNTLPPSFGSASFVVRRQARFAKQLPRSGISRIETHRLAQFLDRRGMIADAEQRITQRKP